MFSDWIWVLWLAIPLAVLCGMLAVYMLEEDRLYKEAVGLFSVLLTVVFTGLALFGIPGAYIDRNNCDKRSHYVESAGYPVTKYWTITTGCAMFVDVDGIQVPYDTWVNNRVLPGGAK